MHVDSARWEEVVYVPVLVLGSIFYDGKLFSNQVT